MTAENAVATTVELHLAFLAALGRNLPPGARVLDFGCGAGASVAYLCGNGFDCFGVDTGAGDSAPSGAAGVTAFPDWRSVWEKSPVLADRVCLLDPNGCRLPFPDRFFDFCFSDQVFEHVADYAAVFREIGRVLKPGAVSLHRFPGPNRLIEGHMRLPFPWLCRCRAYLAACALAGLRAPHQRALSWRQTVRDNRRIMSQTFYPTKRQLQQYARRAGVAIAFCERREFSTCSEGALAAARQRLERVGFGAIGRALLPLVAQRYMLLQATGS